MNLIISMKNDFQEESFLRYHLYTRELSVQFKIPHFEGIQLSKIIKKWLLFYFFFFLRGSYRNNLWSKYESKIVWSIFICLYENPYKSKLYKKNLVLPITTIWEEYSGWRAYTLCFLIRAIFPLHFIIRISRGDNANVTGVISRCSCKGAD